MTDTRTLIERTIAFLENIDHPKDPLPRCLVFNASALASDLRDLIAALPQAHEGWLPIETAPKDGTMILVYGGVAHWYVGNDCDGEWRTLTAEKWPGKTIEWPVEVWMPFPPAAAPPPAPDARLQDVIDTIEGAYQSLIRWHRKKRDEADARLRGLIEKWRALHDDYEMGVAYGVCANDLEASLRAHEGEK